MTENAERAETLEPDPASTHDGPSLETLFREADELAASAGIDEACRHLGTQRRALVDAIEAGEQRLVLPLLELVRRQMSYLFREDRHADAARVASGLLHLLSHGQGIAQLMASARESLASFLLDAARAFGMSGNSEECLRQVATAFDVTRQPELAVVKAIKLALEVPKVELKWRQDRLAEMLARLDFARAQGATRDAVARIYDALRGVDSAPVNPVGRGMAQNLPEGMAELALALEGLRLRALQLGRAPVSAPR